MATSLFHMRRHTAFSAERRPGGILAGLMGALDVWLARRRQRAMLMELPDHMLKDIGISRVDAYQEARKHFWQD